MLRQWLDPAANDREDGSARSGIGGVVGGGRGVGRKRSRRGLDGVQLFICAGKGKPSRGPVNQRRKKRMERRKREQCAGVGAQRHHRGSSWYGRGDQSG
uniref:Uncharacterized protein n=1 Tax=Oryza meridionalis TaxID=40149 RepID=A0A0E0EY95_9ORYZ